MEREVCLRYIPEQGEISDSRTNWICNNEDAIAKTNPSGPRAKATNGSFAVVDLQSRLVESLEWERPNLVAFQEQQSAYVRGCLPGSLTNYF